MPADFLDTIDENEAAFVPISSLAGTEDMVLVTAAKVGSSHAFEVLVEPHGRRILRLAQRVTGNREDAEDVVQQSFQNAFVHLQKFEGRSSFSTWLTRIAINEALMRLRANRRVRAVSIDELTADEETTVALQIPDVGPSPEHSYSQQERKRILSFAMNQLTPGIRAAIQLCELDGRSYKESAQMMGVSVTAAKSRVLRGRRKLRPTLSRHIAPTLMLESEKLQSTTDNSRSPAARAARAETNGGSRGHDLLDSCADGFGVPVRGRPRRQDRIERASVNRVRESTGPPEDELPRTSAAADCV